MSSSHSRLRRSLAVKATELGLAVPQVVAHRITRMALAGVYPNARDRKEFHRMGTEKMAAFAESWNAMTIQVLRANHEAVLSFWRSYWLFGLSGKPSASMHSRTRNSGYRVLNKGLAPVHRRAVANAKRLVRTRLR